jgi:hypothetical protein
MGVSAFETGYSAWSPTGDMLGVPAVVESDGWHLFTACGDGTCTHDLGRSDGFLWSFDGAYIYHVERSSSGSAAVVAVCPDGSCRHAIGPDGDFGDTMSYGGTSMRSHDKRRFAYIGRSDKALYTVTGLGPAVRVSPPGEEVAHFAWMIGDTQIAYLTKGASNATSNVEMACADGSCHALLVGARDATLWITDVVGSLAAPAP